MTAPPKKSNRRMPKRTSNNDSSSSSIFRHGQRGNANTPSTSSPPPSDVVQQEGDDNGEVDIDEMMNIIISTNNNNANEDDDLISVYSEISISMKNRFLCNATDMNANEKQTLLNRRRALGQDDRSIHSDSTFGYNNICVKGCGMPPLHPILKEEVTKCHTRTKGCISKPMVQCATTKDGPFRSALVAKKEQHQLTKQPNCVGSSNSVQMSTPKVTVSSLKDVDAEFAKAYEQVLKNELLMDSNMVKGTKARTTSTDDAKRYCHSNYRSRHDARYNHQDITLEHVRRISSITGSSSSSNSNKSGGGSGISGNGNRSSCGSKRSSNNNKKHNNVGEGRPTQDTGTAQKDYHIIGTNNEEGFFGQTIHIVKEEEEADNSRTRRKQKQEPAQQEQQQQLLNDKEYSLSSSHDEVNTTTNKAMKKSSRNNNNETPLVDTKQNRSVDSTSSQATATSSSSATNDMKQLIDMSPPPVVLTKHTSSTQSILKPNPVRASPNRSVPVEKTVRRTTHMNIWKDTFNFHFLDRNNEQQQAEEEVVEKESNLFGSDCIMGATSSTSNTSNKPKPTLTFDDVSVVPEPNATKEVKTSDKERQQAKQQVQNKNQQQVQHHEQQQEENQDVLETTTTRKQEEKNSEHKEFGKNESIDFCFDLSKTTSATELSNKKNTLHSTQKERAQPINNKKSLQHDKNNNETPLVLLERFDWPPNCYFNHNSKKDDETDDTDNTNDASLGQDGVGVSDIQVETVGEHNSINSDDTKILLEDRDKYHDWLAYNKQDTETRNEFTTDGINNNNVYFNGPGASCLNEENGFWPEDNKHHLRRKERQPKHNTNRRARSHHNVSPDLMRASYHYKDKKYYNNASHESSWQTNNDNWFLNTSLEHHLLYDEEDVTQLQPEEDRKEQYYTSSPTPDFNTTTQRGRSVVRQRSCCNKTGRSGVSRSSKKKASVQTSKRERSTCQQHDPSNFRGRSFEVQQQDDDYYNYYTKDDQQDMIKMNRQDEYTATAYARALQDNMKDESIISDVSSFIIDINNEHHKHQFDQWDQSQYKFKEDEIQGFDAKQPHDGTTITNRQSRSNRSSRSQSRSHRSKSESRSRRSVISQPRTSYRSRSPAKSHSQSCLMFTSSTVGRLTRSPSRSASRSHSRPRSSESPSQSDRLHYKTTTYSPHSRSQKFFPLSDVHHYHDSHPKYCEVLRPVVISKASMHFVEDNRDGRTSFARSPGSSSSTASLSSTFLTTWGRNDGVVQSSRRHNRKQSMQTRKDDGKRWETFE